MSCERARELIMDALVETLEPELARELHDHLAGCAACTSEADASDALWRSLDVAALPKTRPDALERLEASVREELGHEPDRASDGWPRRLRNVAAAVVLVGIGALLAIGVNTLRRPASPDPVPATADGGRYMLILTATTESPELAAQVGREMGAWVNSLQARGIIDSVEGFADGPAVGTPPDGPLMADDIAGFIIIRASSPAEARRIAVQSPSIQYGGFVEIRAIN